MVNTSRKGGVYNERMDAIGIYTTGCSVVYARVGTEDSDCTWLSSLPMPASSKDKRLCHRHDK